VPPVDGGSSCARIGDGNNMKRRDAHVTVSGERRTDPGRGW
jgi:hypothetical protein